MYFDTNSLSEAYSNGVLNDVGTGIEETKTNTEQTSANIDTVFETTAGTLAEGTLTSKWY